MTAPFTPLAPEHGQRRAGMTARPGLRKRTTRRVAVALAGALTGAVAIGGVAAANADDLPSTDSVADAPAESMPTDDGASIREPALAAPVDAPLAAFGAGPDGPDGPAPGPMAEDSPQANQAPVAAPDQYWVAKDQLLVVNTPGVLANDSDADGDVLTPQLVSGPAHGSLSLGATGAFYYDSDLGYTGIDTFSYRASDDAGNLSSAVTVTITVGGAKPGWFAPPVAVADTAVTEKGVSVVIDVLANDLLAPGQTATIGTALDGAAHGTVEVDAAAGTIIYQPAGGYAGPAEFFYSIHDQHGLQSAWVVVRIKVQDANNQPPIVSDLHLQRVKGLAQWSYGNAHDLVSDPDGNEVTITWDTAPSNGTFLPNIGAFGNWQWLPASDFVGVVTIGFTATDVLGASATGTITISVVADPLDPVAVDDVYATPIDTALTVDAAHGLFVNDSDDPAGQWYDMTTMTETSNLAGTLALAWDGSFVFTPATGFSGTTSFFYKLIDDTGRHSASAKVTIHVSGIVPLPTPDAGEEPGTDAGTEPGPSNAPEVPEQPNTPEQPTTPDEPSEPEQPATPEEPTSGAPVTTSAPADPDAAGTTGTPAEPGTARPAQFANGVLPTTGASLSTAIGVVGLVLLLAGALLVRYLSPQEPRTRRYPT